MKKLTPKLTDNPRLPHESFRVVFKNNHAIQSRGSAGVNFSETPYLQDLCCFLMLGIALIP